ncbi:hypothetical protein PG996_015858 [Apiospora saccharicola]|uniref:Uncharacterized protein n=1 Tax=Apiospora saccharicola TaxID=335842 RepID=A0ABR1TPZ8_9PEZI
MWIHTKGRAEFSMTAWPLVTLGAGPVTGNVTQHGMNERGRINANFTDHVLEAAEALSGIVGERLRARLISSWAV